MLCSLYLSIVDIFAYGENYCAHILKECHHKNTPSIVIYNLLNPINNLLPDFLLSYRRKYNCHVYT